MSKKIVILLHGVGSNGADLQGLGDFWQASMPEVIFVAPDAPQHCDMGSGYQWFSVNGVTEHNRPQRVVAARESFDAVIRAILDRHQITAEDQVILTGFSQGSIMSLDAVVRDALPLAGVVAFSGRLASPPPFYPANGTGVLLIHGQADPVIPWTESRDAQQQLADAGAAATFIPEPGLPHTISAQGIAHGGEFIRQRFGL
ncbi:MULTISPECIES: dienelactone hydrolase family protein [unclassified Tatumella]|uniref:alpha/beta hydrolase n=1 Tax=unclassified Tatumella TaxID=2649542 RepID=UPI001BAF8FF4|nr:MULTISPECIES: dienelactone hydrolase family protein [unclassified Tatumella]MBS0876166.1 dienelactone hydrolase family protein [Tatumella sp. JGM82]MBS0889214.1 dienelactone hydrolase family protein [Tatumella sp. JGM94]MBS0901096.1 dienelactone hydrolase family protein [Tatumella sp. JGM100]